MSIIEKAMAHSLIELQNESGGGFCLGIINEKQRARKKDNVRGRKIMSENKRTNDENCNCIYQ